MSDKETNAKPNEINLTVKAQDGTVICFKLRKNTQLKKLMDTYCTRHGLVAKSVRFIYEGDRLKENDTPESLDMQDGDEIDAMVEQHGGRQSQNSHLFFNN